MGVVIRWCCGHTSICVSRVYAFSFGDVGSQDFPIDGITRMRKSTKLSRFWLLCSELTLVAAGDQAENVTSSQWTMVCIPYIP